MKLVFLPGWHRTRPRSVRRSVWATIFRAPVEEVVTKEARYFDAHRVRACGVVRTQRCLVLGAKDRTEALAAAQRALRYRSEHHEVLRSARRLQRGLVAQIGDVVVYNEALE